MLDIEEAGRSLDGSCLNMALSFRTRIGQGSRSKRELLIRQGKDDALRYALLGRAFIHVKKTKGRPSLTFFSSRLRR